MIHVAITRTVKPGCEEAFELAIRNFFADSLKETPTLGAQLLRPLPGSENRTYGILRSFASEEDREGFYASESFNRWQEAVEAAVTELMDTYYNPDKPDKGINGADPFVIAPAQQSNPVLTVVSGEKPGSAENPKIPYVCGQRDVQHKNFLGLIQDQGWQF